MDKFVERRPRNPQEKRATKRKESKLKQVTIKSLPSEQERKEKKTKARKKNKSKEKMRVVVLEDILHLKSALEAHKNDTNEDKLLEILEKLKSMNPSTQILKDTKIGRSVNKLRKSEHQSVREVSKLVVAKWKKLVKDDNTRKESIDVRCDAKTELLRCKARKLISDALIVSFPDPWTEALEKRLFEECQRRVDNRYKRSVRSIVFLIKSDKNVQENVKQGTMTHVKVLSRCLYAESKK